MDIFPVEVWGHIVNYACMDGGKTARSLSLTCWNLYHVTQEFMLQSISLVNARQILRFCAALDGYTSHMKSTKYLFIGCLRPSITLASLNLTKDVELINVLQSLRQSDSLGNIESQTPVAINISDSPSGQCVTIDDVSIGKAFYRVIGGLKHTLTILHLHLIFVTRPTPLLPVDVPGLEELAIFGQFNNSSWNPSTGPWFKSLKRLYLAQFHPRDITTVMSSIAPLAPALTHLCLPRFKNDLDGVSSEPEEWLKKVAEKRDELWKPRLGMQLKLFLEVDETHWAAFKRSGLVVDNISEQIQHLSEVIVTRAGRLWVNVHLAEKTWREIISGGTGPWKLPG